MLKNFNLKIIPFRAPGLPPLFLPITLSWNSSSLLAAVIVAKFTLLRMQNSQTYDS